jgi:hypothetical protein
MSESDIIINLLTELVPVRAKYVNLAKQLYTHVSNPDDKFSMSFTTLNSVFQALGAPVAHAIPADDQNLGYLNIKGVRYYCDPNATLREARTAYNVPTTMGRIQFSIRVKQRSAAEGGPIDVATFKSLHVTEFEESDNEGDLGIY